MRTSAKSFPFLWMTQNIWKMNLMIKEDSFSPRLQAGLAWNEKWDLLWNSEISQGKSGRICNTPSPIHLCVLSTISEASSGNYLGSDAETYISYIIQPVFFITSANKNLHRPKPFSYPHIFPHHVGGTYTECYHKPLRSTPKRPQLLAIYIHGHSGSPNRQLKISGACKKPWPSLGLQDRKTKSSVTRCDYWHRHMHNISHCSLLCNFCQQLIQTGISYHPEASRSAKDAAKHQSPAKLFGVVKKCPASSGQEQTHIQSTPCMHKCHGSHLTPTNRCTLFFTIQEDKKDAYEAYMCIVVNIDRNILYVLVKFCHVIHKNKSIPRQRCHADF